MSEGPKGCPIQGCVLHQRSKRAQGGLVIQVLANEGNAVARIGHAYTRHEDTFRVESAGK
jgi:hypothetical protein